VSDSILYLAIVAIWACFLIPAWVRRPNTAKSETESQAAEFDIEADTQPDADRPPGHSMMAEVTPEPTGFAANADNAAEADDSEYRDEVHMHSYGPDDSRRPATGPSQSRQQMMRARRRMLTILTGLTVLTIAFVLAGLVQWWICVPPAAMLVLYVLLLREIAMADAELARKRRAWEARMAYAAQQRARELWEAEAAEAAEPGAEIIDISGRVRDQLYDQYADAAVRAVGD
jgi:hypothetical protein